MSLKAIIFDYDGVIVESMDLKAEAFAYVFRDCPEDVIQQVVQLHRDNGGMSRFEKFRIIYRDFLNQELTPEEEDRLAKEFSEYVFDRTVKSPFVKGTVEFLKKNYRKYTCFVASSIPHEEINKLIDAQNLRKYFKGVWGIPGEYGKDKGELAKWILVTFELDPDEVVLIGDAPNDYRAAEFAGVSFVARILADGYNPFESGEYEIQHCLNDLTTFEKLLKEEFA